MGESKKRVVRSYKGSARTFKLDWGMTTAYMNHTLTVLVLLLRF